MSDHIIVQLKGGTPGSLADGELAIDETRSLLEINTAHGLQSIPLDRQPLPTPSPDLEARLIQTADGAGWARLQGGGGARPFDAQKWRVPGIAPTGVIDQDYLAPDVFYALFEVEFPVTLAQVSLNVTANAGIVQFGVVLWNDGQPGAILVAASQSGIGLETQAVSVSLEPGVYAAYVRGSANFTCKAITGFPVTARLNNAGQLFSYCGASGFLGLVGTQPPLWTDLDGPSAYPVSLGF